MRDENIIGLIILGLIIFFFIGTFVPIFIICHKTDKMKINLNKEVMVGNNKGMCIGVENTREYRILINGNTVVVSKEYVTFIEPSQKVEK